MLIGIESFLKNPNSSKTWGRCALACNQASVLKNISPSWKAIREVLGDRLVAFLGPQHGIECTVQENMIETGHSTHRVTGLPVHSLYSETREPTAEMLDSVDTILIDLPISGCRIYTYKYTMAGCLRAAKKFGKRVVVFDRPNPLGGTVIEGNVLSPETRSFVGEFEIPIRHGLTMAEVAHFFNAEIGAELETIKMQSWNPNFMWDENDYPWVLMSPNLAIAASCYTFPGMVLFEGTNVSEGRGTCLPFLFIGAPFIDSTMFKEAILAKIGHPPGIVLREASFQPTNSKWQGIECFGVQIHVTSSREVRSFKLALAMLRSLIELAPKDFSWRPPPYEYETKIDPIDILVGKQGVKELLALPHFNIHDECWTSGQKNYLAKVGSMLLYDREIKSN